MKFKTLTLSALTLLAGIAATSPAALAADADKGTYKIDPVHSSVLFTVTHLGVARFTGRFDAISGELTADGTGAGNSVTVEVDATSVNSGFADRDKHLKSPDFFSVAQFPTITFKSTEVKLDDSGKGTLAGDLTLRGVTKPVTFALQHIGAGADPWGGYRSGYTATTTIKRSEWGVDFLLGGISDDVDLVVNIESIKQ